MSTAVYTYSARPIPEAHDRQKAECEELARELGRTITRTYQDEGRARLALERLLADAREHNVSVLVVASLDRLGRQLGTFAPVMEALHDAGMTVYAARQGKADAAESPLLGITHAIADYEDEHAEDITH